MNEKKMKKIYNIFYRSRKEQKCPECESDRLSIAVDSVIGYWYVFCEVCGTKGPERDLIAMKNKGGAVRAKMEMLEK